jgi:hypothetical protein
MTDMADRRRTARITFPRRLNNPDLQLQLGRILDLSPAGARLQHADPLHEGIECLVDLPPMPERVRLTARVAWTRQHGSEHTLEGERHLIYQSGVTFTSVTPEQNAILTKVLEMLTAAS